MKPLTITHIAGEVVVSKGRDARIVQRCAWCGAVLINETAATFAVSPPKAYGTPPPTYPLWPAGEMVQLSFEVRAMDSIVVRREWIEGDGSDEPPADACIRRGPL